MCRVTQTASGVLRFVRAFLRPDGAAVGLFVRSSVSLLVVVVVGTVVAAAPVAVAVGAAASDPRCALADALKRDGEREAAHAEYLKVLRANPTGAPCADAGLVATQPPSEKSLSSTVGD